MARVGGYQADRRANDRPLKNTQSVRVEPARGDFNDVELSLTYVVPFTIHNTSNKMKRIRFIPPRTGPFQLNHVPQNIAPGLSQIVEVEFSTNMEKDYQDEWCVGGLGPGWVCEWLWPWLWLWVGVACRSSQRCARAASSMAQANTAWCCSPV